MLNQRNINMIASFNAIRAIYLDEKNLKQSYPPLETLLHKVSSRLEKCPSLIEQIQKKRTKREDPYFCGICYTGVLDDARNE